MPRCLRSRSIVYRSNTDPAGTLSLHSETLGYESSTGHRLEISFLCQGTNLPQPNGTSILAFQRRELPGPKAWQRRSSQVGHLSRLLLWVRQRGREGGRERERERAASKQASGLRHDVTTQRAHGVESADLRLDLCSEGYWDYMSRCATDDSD